MIIHSLKNKNLKCHKIILQNASPLCTPEQIVYISFWHANERDVVSVWFLNVEMH